MAGINNMTKLLNKAERRLGLSVIKLPDKLKKDKWADIVKEDTIPTFSRYFPFKYRVILDDRCKRNGYYFVDRDIPEGLEIIGIKDIAWGAYSDRDLGGDSYNYGTYNFLTENYGAEEIGLLQLRADFISLFNMGIYIEEYLPNKIKLVSTNGAPVSLTDSFPVDVFTNQPDNLMGISPTMMETFEKLAFSDIALFLYQNLKYYDQMDTTFGNLDLKLDTLQDWANRREDIVNQLDEAHVSAANDGQPLIMSV